MVGTELKSPVVPITMKSLFLHLMWILVQREGKSRGRISKIMVDGFCMTRRSVSACTQHDQ